MKIDINGVIRDMTEEEEKEYQAAIADQEATETPESLDEKVDKLTGMVQGLTDLLKSKFSL